MIRDACKRFLRFWAPSGLLAAYRASHAQRSRRQIHRRNEDPWLPKVRIEELFPGVDSLAVNLPVSLVSSQDEWILPPRELAALAAICVSRRPHRVFEIGTYTGSSTLAMALNTPETSRVFTLDVDPALRATHKHGLGVGGFPEFEVGSCYRASGAGSKISQLLGNSCTYDYTPFHRSIDLVLVDADHTYDFVRKDTETALALLAPEGIIVWDDYVWNERHPECAGVTRCLNELARSRNVYQIECTRLAVYRDGPSQAAWRS